jgi:hypothetical protein
MRDTHNGDCERLNEALAKIYPPEFISKLAKDFKISDSTIMDQALKGAASVYLAQRNEELTSESEHAFFLKIIEINSLAAQLLERLASLSELEKDRFWLPLRYKPLFAPNSEPETYFGYPISKHICHNGAIAIHCPNEYLVEQSVQLLSRLVDHAISRRKPDTGGHPSSDALRMWVINMQTLWESLLKRPFTHAQDAGIPTSPAFSFCQTALAPLDPSVKTSLIGTTMRKVIEETPVALRLRNRRKLP